MLPPGRTPKPTPDPPGNPSQIPKGIRDLLTPNRLPPLETVDVQTMRNLPPPGVQWLVEDMLALAEPGILLGRSNSGKGFICLMLIMAVATGRGIFGRKGSGKPMKVLFLEMEDSQEEIHRRIYRLLYLMRQEKDWGSADEDNLFNNLVLLKPNYKSEDPKTLKGLMPEIQKQVEETLKAGIKIGLVVLDTLAALSEGEENAVDAQRETLAAFFHLRELTGACVLAVHHTRKPSTYGKAMPIFERLSFDSSRGSSAIVAAMRFILQMEPITVSEAQKLDLDEDKAIRGGYVVLTLSKVVSGPKGDLMLLEQQEGVGGGFWTRHPNSEELVAKLKSKTAVASITLAEAVLLSIADKVVDRDELCRRHWPGVDERKARNNLKATLSHLRHRHRWLQEGAEFRITVQGAEMVEKLRARGRPVPGGQQGNQTDSDDDLL